MWGRLGIAGLVELAAFSQTPGSPCLHLHHFTFPPNPRFSSLGGRHKKSEACAGEPRVSRGGDREQGKRDVSVCFCRSRARKGMNNQECVLVGVGAEGWADGAEPGGDICILAPQGL